MLAHAGLPFAETVAMIYTVGLAGWAAFACFEFIRLFRRRQ